nr:venom polypeptide precursor [Doratifera vulnerans]
MLKLTLLLCVLALIAQPALFQNCTKLNEQCYRRFGDRPNCCGELACSTFTTLCEELPKGLYK